MLDAYLRLEDADELTARFCLDAMLDPDLPLGEQLEAAVEMRARFTGPLVRAAGVKLFVDGVLETHTGYLARTVRRPARLPRHADLGAGGPRRGLRRRGSGRVPAALSRDRRCRRLARAGCDRGGQGRRSPELATSSTHLQVWIRRTSGRMSALGVVAAVQPYWFTSDPITTPRLRRAHRRTRRLTSTRCGACSTPASTVGRRQRLPRLAAAGPAARHPARRAAARPERRPRERRAVARGDGRRRDDGRGVHHRRRPRQLPRSTRPGRSRRASRRTWWC